MRKQWLQLVSLATFVLLIWTVLSLAQDQSAAAVDNSAAGGGAGGAGTAASAVMGAAIAVTFEGGCDDAAVARPESGQGGAVEPPLTRYPRLARTDG